MIARTLAALIGLAFLSGCIDMLPGSGPAAKLYTLSPKSTFSDSLPPVDWQLVVELPIGAETLNTPRIALSRTPLTLDYYGGSRWSERAPVMVRAMTESERCRSPFQMNPPSTTSTI